MSSATRCARRYTKDRGSTCGNTISYIPLLKHKEPSMSFCNGREYVSFKDPDSGTLYEFDVTFLLSQYNCTYNNGCKGMTHVPEHGCCIHGVVMGSDYEQGRITKYVEMLDSRLWQNHGKYHDEWHREIEDDDVGRNTVVVNGVCVFHNDSDHDHPGCALWHLAHDIGVHPDITRPDPCGYYPLSRAEDDDRVRIEPITRQYGSSMADEGNGWWCIDDPANYSDGNVYAYIQYWETLIRMSSEPVMEMFHEWAVVRWESLPEKYGSPADAREEWNHGLFSTVPVTLTRKAP